jgi:hypothetical protein
MEVLFVITFVTVTTAAPGSNTEAIYLREQLTLVPELTIGGGRDEGDSPPPFYRPRDVDFGRDGQIYVLDAETCEVVVFDRAGSYKSRFAGEGEGPGQLREPIGIAVSREGGVLIYESGNKRFSWFNADGEFVKARRFGEQVSQFTCTTDGLILAQTEVEHYGATMAQTEWALVALDSTLATVTVLDSLTSQRWISARSGSNIASSTQPFYEELLWCVGPTGDVYVGRNMTYQVEVLSSAFRPVRTIRREAPAVPIGADDRNRYLETLGGSSAWARKDLETQVRWPKHKPYMQALCCDSHGYLLVHRGATKGVPAIDVYRPDGTFVGGVSVPGFRYNAVFVGDSVFMRVFSNEQLPAVIRYRME